MSDKSVETLDSKIRFSAFWKDIPPPLSPKTIFIFLFLLLQRLQRLHNIELGGRGIRDLTLDANKLEQMLKYRKSSFPKSVSTTFVAYCSFLAFEAISNKPDDTWVSSEISGLEISLV